VIEAEGVDALVVGLPLRTDGRTRRRRRACGAWRAARALGLPVELVDERFTSQAASARCAAAACRSASAARRAASTRRAPC
jgi:RNase H-fold protein (predicted Holliday junction resolvase)